MNQNMFNGPIPGESLTREPGNAPWEQPSKFSDPEEALEWHLKKYNDEEIIDDLLFILDQGFPLNVLVESILTGAVSDGIHTIDISILIAPIIHEYLMALAKAAKIEVTEFDEPSKGEKKAMKQKERQKVILMNALSNSGGESEVVDMAMTGQESPAPADPEMGSQGFMKRRV